MKGDWAWKDKLDQQIAGREAAPSSSIVTVRLTLLSWVKLWLVVTASILTAALITTIVTLFVYRAVIEHVSNELEKETARMHVEKRFGR